MDNTIDTGLSNFRLSTKSELDQYMEIEAGLTERVKTPARSPCPRSNSRFFFTEPAGEEKVSLLKSNTMLDFNEMDYTNTNPPKAYQMYKHFKKNKTQSKMNDMVQKPSPRAQKKPKH